MSAGTLAIVIAGGFAVVALFAGMRGTVRDVVTARRGLAMSALFSAVALLMLLRGLWQPDYSLAFVARHVLRSMPPGGRLLSLGAEPGGVALLVATVVAAAAVLWSRGLPAVSLAVGGGSILVLLATPLVAGTLRRLPWLPIDGDAMSPLFLEGSAGWSLAALAIAAAFATAAVARAVAGRQDGDALRLALLSVAAYELLRHRASVASGVESAAALTATAANGGLLAVAIVALAAIATSWRPLQVSLESSLAALLALVGLVLTPAGAGPTSSVMVLWGVAGVTAVRAIWRAWPASIASVLALRGAWRRGQHARVLSVLSLVVSGLAVGADVVTVRVQPVVGPGERAEVGAWGSVVQQGVSAYDDSTGTVLAVALEATRRWHAGPALGSATQRELVDVRGRIVGGVTRKPAWFSGGDARWVMAVDSVTAGDRAHLTLQIVPLPWLWWLALLCLAAALVLPNAPSLRGADVPAPAEGTSP